MSGIGHAKLAAQRGGGHACGMVGEADAFWIRNGSEQVADKTVEFGIGDEVRSLLLQKRSAEHPGEAEQRGTSAGQTVGPVVGSDQFTLHAKCRSLQGDEINLFQSSAIHGLTKHEFISSPMREE